MRGSAQKEKDWDDRPDDRSGRADHHLVLICCREGEVPLSRLGVGVSRHQRAEGQNTDGNGVAAWSGNGGEGTPGETEKGENPGRTISEAVARKRGPIAIGVCACARKRG